ncbi:hypothetical protein [Nocardia jiangxiensis]|uniref:Uncharacterized protein n=1 Tax=Nocardia jiangxiensis TaxID=282685 RepID=A0ABW6RVR4_9NOCA|nr:hypothetical protein [Nocardia jiangxiensis]
MTSSTPWHVHDDSENLPAPPIRHTRLVTQRISTVRADKGYVAAAVAAALTLILMFQPWLTASGPNGRLRSDAFGRIDGATRGYTDWLTTGYTQPSISGVWAVLAALAAVVTISAVLMYLRIRTDALSYLVLGASLATAMFVLADLLYLSGKAPELRSMVQGNNGFGDGLGSLLDMFLGDGTSRYGTHQVASAGLDPAAMLCGAAAFGGAVAAIASGARKHTWYTMRLVAPRPRVTALPAPEVRNERTVITVG